MKNGRGALALPILVALIVGCGSGSPVDTTVASIEFATQALPAAGAGELYNSVIFFNTDGGAALPDRFDIRNGVLPPGVRLVNDRADTNGDGLPDADGALTGHARLIGFPRDIGSFSFTIQAVSTGVLAGLAQNSGQPDLLVTQDFVINVGEGSVKILTPTSVEGTLDPALPEFPETITFVNPANPQAFFSSSFFVAGGSSSRLLNIYIPREVELSQFDGPVTDGTIDASFDLDEGPTSGDKFENNFADGGWFVLQAGNEKVQFGGFQSPRGPVGTIDNHAGGAGLDPEWFQRASIDSGPARNSRRTSGGLAGNVPGPAGDSTLGTDLPIQFSDYFDDLFEGTHPSFTPPVDSGLQRRKYPFTIDQYQNAFFLPFDNTIHVTPLRYRAIVEAIDTRGTPDKADDVIDRKAYIIQVTIPDIVIDTVVLPSGQAGVDYNEFVNASGGVPPLSYELEFIDNTSDLAITDGDPLDKQLFGVEVDPRTGQFFGVPRSSDTVGNIEISVRVFAAVMNPLTQDTDSFIPFPGGKSNGEHPVTGKRGAHKTIPVVFDAPDAPFIVNGSLAAGDDGLPYPGDTIVGGGGVPLLVPYPVGFTANTYPSALAARNYTFGSSFPLDTSHATPGLVVAGLPNGMALDGVATSPTNGSFTGTPTDRGFQAITFQGLDFFAGSAPAAHPTNNQIPFAKVLTLSVSPDTAIYMRGKAPIEGPGTPAGVIENATAIVEPRMAPLFQSSSIFRTETGKAAGLVNSAIPGALDVIPVLIPNGGSKSHVDKSHPSITGFWPAEAGSEDEWDWGADGAWRHLQQEFVWLQANNKSHARVFLLGETLIKTFAGAPGGTSADSKRYQQYVVDGKRVVMVADPLAGNAWFPAILENDNADHGVSFGCEYVQSRGFSENFLEGQHGTGYFAYSDHALTQTRGAREMHTQGLGSYLEPHRAVNAFANANTSQGRSGSTVAMSHDGIWCATGLFGGDQAKLLVWRTDGRPIPAGLLGSPNAVGLDGQDLDGNVLQGSAAIIQLGGVDKDLAGDSIMFVPNGILFLKTNALSTVFGVSVTDGHFSEKSVNTRDTLNGAGTGPAANATDGMFIPDRDHLKGIVQKPAYSVQFAWAGNEPAAGSHGPDKVVFVAGDNSRKGEFTDLPGSRDGWSMVANKRKALLFMDLADGPAGFDAADSTITDLTGSDPQIQGDFLTPGAAGDGQDWLVLSKSGDYAALVTDGRAARGTGTPTNFTMDSPTFASPRDRSGANFNGWVANHDVLIIATGGDDLDTGKGGAQHVLLLGTGDTVAVNPGDPPGMPAYASGRNYFNGQYKRMQGLEFSADEQVLYLQYAGGTTRSPAYHGQDDGWGPNADSKYGVNFATIGAEIIAQIRFLDEDGDAVNFSSPGVMGNNITNGLDDLDGITGVGDTSADFGATGSQNIMWSRFRSANGNFLYYFVDGVTDRNFIVGFNTSGNAINGHEPHAPFSPHAPEVAFEQFDYGAWNFESRLAASPGGVALNGFDASGIVCVIGNDASSPNSPTDLDVYAFNANRGTDLVAVTSAVTDGNANAINHLYLSADGNTLVGQRSETTASSRTGRETLNGDNDLFCVNNLHAVVFGGAAPNAFMISEDRSHGATVAFIGEGTISGPQVVVYSAADQVGGNETWDDRTLRAAQLAPGAGAIATVIDSVRSHYAVIVAGRKLNDNPDTAD